jgi:hypothetical protein
VNGSVAVGALFGPSVRCSPSTSDVGPTASGLTGLGLLPDELGDGEVDVLGDGEVDGLVLGEGDTDVEVLGTTGGTTGGATGPLAASATLCDIEMN